MAPLGGPECVKSYHPKLPFKSLHMNFRKIAHEHTRRLKTHIKMLTHEDPRMRANRRRHRFDRVLSSWGTSGVKVRGGYSPQLFDASRPPWGSQHFNIFNKRYYIFLNRSGAAEAPGIRPLFHISVCRHWGGGHFFRNTKNTVFWGGAGGGVSGVRKPAFWAAPRRTNN